MQIQIQVLAKDYIRQMVLPIILFSRNCSDLKFKISATSIIKEWPYLFDLLKQLLFELLHKR